MRSGTSLTRVLLIVVALAYLASWALPALTFVWGKEPTVWPGIACFFEGIFFGAFMLHFEAFANLLIIPALFFAWFNKWELALVLTVIALPMAAETFFLTSVPANEAGDMARLTEYGPGFYLWTGSFVVMFIVSLLKVLEIFRARRLNVQISGNSPIGAGTSND